nr:immunoglobulin light chain junction region [Macaca mulatta]MOW28354.1 immunoglobulin light chain junction region [Macaca mulatta]MOW29039.1 immunoglobulin light chain junction region [Macaca mulatta]MOW29198.1 immunoglobulin light chain junction region [Macaca mulatta]MOW29296.1 immunoglobulin light chain junction region [Macaca mulatta]
DYYCTLYMGGGIWVF